MKRNDAVFLGALLAGAAGFALFARAPATNAVAPSAGAAEIVAATFNSAWCASCKILKPRLVRTIPFFEGRPIAFVEYDLSFGDTPALRRAAAADGLAAVYDRFAGATGYTLLVDPQTGAIVDMLTVNHSPAAMRAAIDRALAAASAE